MSIPVAIERLACGSRSIASTLRPRSASAAATLRVLVVLAVPPFWLKKARMRVIVAALRLHAVAAAMCTYAAKPYHAGDGEARRPGAPPLAGERRRPVSCIHDGTRGKGLSARRP